jgi:hypothetical protein
MIPVSVSSDFRRLSLQFAVISAILVRLPLSPQA